MAQAQKGKGYYGAHGHDVPYGWTRFRRVLQSGLETPFAKARYVHYLVSWWCHHEVEPELGDIHSDERIASLIMDQVRELVAVEVQRLADMAQ